MRSRSATGRWRVESCTHAVVGEKRIGFLMGCQASNNRPVDVPCVAQPFFIIFIRKSGLIGKHEYPRRISAYPRSVPYSARIQQV